MLMLVFTFLVAQISSHNQQITDRPIIHTDYILCSRHSKSKVSAKSRTKTKSQPVIQETIHNGRYIRLSDNSLWEINPKDVAITQSWMTPAEIITTPTDDPTYPFKLKNSLTGSSVQARSIPEIPNK